MPLCHFCHASRRYGDEYVQLTRFRTPEDSLPQSYFLLSVTDGVNSSEEPSKLDYPETMKTLYYPYSPFLKGSSSSNRGLYLGQDHGNAQILNFVTVSKYGGPKKCR